MFLFGLGIDYVLSDDKIRSVMTNVSTFPSITANVKSLKTISKGFKKILIWLIF